MRKLAPRYAFFIILMLFLSVNKNVYSWSLLTPDIVGKWEQDSSSIWPLTITFYPNGTMLIAGREQEYSINGSQIRTKVTGIFGNSSEGTHKYNIDGDILTFDPPFYSVTRFRKVK